MAEGSFSPEVDQGIIPRKFIEVEGTGVSYVERGNSYGKTFIYLGGWASAAEGDKWFLDSLEGKVPNSRGFRALKENKPLAATSLEKEVEALKGDNIGF